MAAYDYYNSNNPAAAKTHQDSQTPLSISPPGSQNPSPYHNESPYNPSLDDVRTTYKPYPPNNDPYSPHEDTGYHSGYNRDSRYSSYGENIPLSEHPQHMAGAAHQPAYAMNNATLPAPVPPMREKAPKGFWAKRRSKGIPFFCWTISLVQLIVFIIEIVRNAQLTGSPIQTQPNFNPMIGPSPYVMINMGARFVPCMKEELTVGSGLSQVWPCPNSTSNTLTSANSCSLQELCGFDYFESPNQWYRFIVPMFMHAGLIHIGFNLLIQLTLGVSMEREIGIIRFAIVYFAAGIFGFILGGNFAGQGIVSTGASGALFGILALVLLDLLYTWKQRQSPWKDLMFIIIDFVIAFVIGLLPGIDNFAHIGGFLAGICLGLAVMRSPPALQSKLGNNTDNYNHMSSAAIQNQGLRRLVKDPVGFFRGRNPFWWVWWLIRAGMVTLAVIVFIILLRNFYIYNQTCSWCKHFTCLPISNWCDLGNLQQTNIQQAPPPVTTSPARMFL